MEYLNFETVTFPIGPWGQIVKDEQKNGAGWTVMGIEDTRHVSLII